MPQFLAFLFILHFSCAALSAQEAPVTFPTPSDLYEEKKITRHDFDEKKWESLKKGIDYSARKELEKKQAEQMPEEAPRESLGLGPMFKWFAIIVAVGLLVLFIAKMAGGKNQFGPKNNKLKSVVSAAELDKIEENLPQAELKDPIQRAIATGEYPMAVRLYYLAVLKELSNKKHIRWKRDKTNGAYLRELAGSPLHAPVLEATLAFERVWYGKVELPKGDFVHLELKFKEVLARLGT